MNTYSNIALDDGKGLIQVTFYDRPRVKKNDLFIKELVCSNGCGYQQCNICKINELIRAHNKMVG